MKHPVNDREVGFALIIAAIAVGALLLKEAGLI
jgi:hypothetical protein